MTTGYGLHILTCDAVFVQTSDVEIFLHSIADLWAIAELIAVTATERCAYVCVRGSDGTAPLLYSHRMLDDVTNTTSKEAGQPRLVACRCLRSEEVAKTIR